MDAMTTDMVSNCRRNRGMGRAANHVDPQHEHVAADHVDPRHEHAYVRERQLTYKRHGAEVIPSLLNGFKRLCYQTIFIVSDNLFKWSLVNAYDRKAGTVGFDRNKSECLVLS